MLFQCVALNGIRNRFGQLLAIEKISEVMQTADQEGLTMFLMKAEGMVKRMEEDRVRKEIETENEEA